MGFRYDTYVGIIRGKIKITVMNTLWSLNKTVDMGKI